MSERVQCAECERQYDSDEHPFCPRCGATARSDPIQSAKSLASRSDPRRRRVQMAGVIMLSTGLLVLLAGVAMLASAGSVWDFADSYNEGDATPVGGELSQTASAVNVTVLMDGEPVEGANLTLRSGDEVIGMADTGSDGSATFDGVMSFVVSLQVIHQDLDWTLEFIPVSANGDGMDGTMDLQLELTDQSVVNGPIMDRGMVESTTRVLGIGAILLGLTPVIGGIAAIRLKNQQLAFFGAVIGGIPWLFLFVASMSLPILVVSALFVMAVVFVRQGRDLFV